MPDDLTLAPVPRQLTRRAGMFRLTRNGAIALDDAGLLFEAIWMQGFLRTCGLHYAVGLVSTAQTNIRLTLDTAQGAQAYQLTIADDGVTISGGDAAGVFYGLCTLRQIILNVGETLPALTIDDAPDFKERGYMLDISRDRVPTRETLYQLVDELAALKYNQLQLYTEHTFAYPGHEIVWEQSSPLTSEDVLLLDAYCRQRHIELVPNQNSLGHMERWLKHAPYVHLAESPDGFTDPHGNHRPPSTIAPLEPGSLALMTELYDVLLPHFCSQRVNVGCDEPWDLGRGRSKAAVEARGGRVYFDWLVALHRDLSVRGVQMMFWGDIINHHPELIPELPDDVIVLEWGYEANHPFAAHSQRYADAGIPFYVCPGTSSWNSLTGRTDNAVENIRQAALHGLAHGAQGLLVTDWGDHGHWQPYPVSYVGMVAGGALAWNRAGGEALDYTAALDRLIYHDHAGVMGAFTVAIGNVYQQIGPPYINGQIPAYALQWPPERVNAMRALFERIGAGPADIAPDNLRRYIARIDALAAGLPDARMERPDADLIIREWQQAAALLAHGAKWLLLVQGEADATPAECLREWDLLAANQRDLWLARSRRGGLEDSMRRFAILRDAYRSMA